MMNVVKPIAPTGIRFPDPLKKLLREVAKVEGRSLNNEVIKRIERSLREDGFIKA